jgi:DNA-binding response OmpR family regulator
MRVIVIAQLFSRKPGPYNGNVPPSPRRNIVLVVEDDPELRVLYRTALQIDGFTVVTVGDGIDALRHIDDERPDVVVLDLGLPRLGGRDVHREIASRADTRDIPIVIVTGSDAPDLKPKDFACILRKPFATDALVSAVRRCLEKL